MIWGFTGQSYFWNPFWLNIWRVGTRWYNLSTHLLMNNEMSAPYIYRTKHVWIMKQMPLSIDTRIHGDFKSKTSHALMTHFNIGEFLCWAANEWQGLRLKRGVVDISSSGLDRNSSEAGNSGPLLVTSGDASLRARINLLDRQLQRWGCLYWL